MQAVAEQTGITPEELHQPEPHIAVQYLLGIFYQLSLSRQTGMALNPLTYGEIWAWQRLYQTPLASWEVDVIKQLDILFLNAQQD